MLSSISVVTKQEPSQRTEFDRAERLAKAKDRHCSVVKRDKAAGVSEIGDDIPDASSRDLCQERRAKRGTKTKRVKDREQYKLRDG